jgi:D-proline reductase (dithiol) PrdB
MMDHVRYIDRTREDYIRQGYEKPYEWAHFDEVPFTPLKKPLSQCRVGLLGTSEVAVRFDPATEQNPISEEDFRGVYPIPADTPTEKLYSRTLSFDRNATHLDDVNAFYPVDRLREAVADGRVGSMPSRILGAYNNYSQRKVLTQEAPKALAVCREEGLDAIVMVPV